MVVGRAQPALALASSSPGPSQLFSLPGSPSLLVYIEKIREPGDAATLAPLQIKIYDRLLCMLQSMCVQQWPSSPWEGVENLVRIPHLQFVREET